MSQDRKSNSKQNPADSDSTTEYGVSKRLIKTISSFEIGEPLSLDATNVPHHMVYHAKKVNKATGSDERNNKKWVYKSLEVNPAYQEHYPDEPIKTNEHRLKVDIVVSEHIHILGNSPYKARLVSDDKKQNIVGKASTFIPGLRVFGDIIAPFMESLMSTGQNINYDELKKAGLQYWMDFLRTSPDFHKTLRSLARATICIHRFDIADLHANNIGLDQFGEVVLFDVEHAFNTSLGNSYYGHSSTPQPLNFSNITLQPSNYFNRVVGVLDNSYGPIDLSGHLNSEEMKLFQREVNRTLLKTFLFPPALHWAICKKITLDNNSVTNRLFLLFEQSTRELQASLEKNPSFQNYIMHESQFDIESILKEYSVTKSLHKHYFEEDYLSKFFELEILERYYKLISTIQNPMIFDFIKEQVALPEKKADEIASLTNELHTSVSQYKKDDAATVTRREKALIKGAEHFHQIAEDKAFDATTPANKLLLKTIMATPRFAYRLILSAFYMNKEKSLDILLPLYLNHKTGPLKKLHHPIDHVDEFGKTLLHYAMETASLNAFHLLMSRGADFCNMKPPGRPLSIVSLLCEDPESIYGYLFMRDPTILTKRDRDLYCGKTMTDWIEAYNQAAQSASVTINTAPEFKSQSSEAFIANTWNYFLTNQLTTHNSNRLDRRELNRYKQERSPELRKRAVFRK